MSRTVLVVGGSRGIGHATASMFAKDGYRVAATYRTIPPEDEWLTVRCDVTEADSVEQAFDETEASLGPIEILVVSAGITSDRLMARMTEEDFRSVLDTNLTGAFRAAKRALPRMLRARWGRLVFVSSAVGMRGERGQANYAASKAGLVGLARSLAREVGSRAITANVVAPGLTATDMTAALTEDQRGHLLGQIPLGRMADPEEIAAAIRFLADEHAGYLTGAVLPVDGGAGMGH